MGLSLKDIPYLTILFPTGGGYKEGMAIGRVF